MCLEGTAGWDWRWKLSAAVPKRAPASPIARARSSPTPPRTCSASRSSRGRPTSPGLIVAYYLESIDGAVFESLQAHRPGQALWGHASRWTSLQPIAAVSR